MRAATTQKLHPDRSDSDSYWPIDRATHQDKIDGLVTSNAPDLPTGLITAIESSRRLLALGPSWDDADAKPIAFDTWSVATRLLRDTVINCGGDVDVPIPNISPCSDGSIDLFWKLANFTLLINIKPSVNKSDFYGETVDGLVFEGTFNCNTRHF
jgi:hypothetical protein